MSKLLFFDIDGTLIDYRQKMPASTAVALNQAKARGHKIFICTGRSKNQIYEFLLDFGFDGIVAAAGAYVEYNGQVLYHRVFSPEMVRGVIAFSRASECSIMFQNKTNCISSSEWVKSFDRFFEENLGKKIPKDDITFANRTIDDDIESYPNKYTDIESLVYCQSKIAVDQVQQFLPDGLKVTVSSFKNPEPYSGEVTMAGVTKAVGIQKLLDEFGCTVEDVIAFGDGANDIEMIEFAGIGVAMGNGQECVKSVADMITEDIDKDGLYLAMKRLALL